MVELLRTLDRRRVSELGLYEVERTRTLIHVHAATAVLQMKPGKIQTIASSLLLKPSDLTIKTSRVAPKIDLIMATSGHFDTAPAARTAEQARGERCAIRWLAKQILRIPVAEGLTDSAPTLINMKAVEYPRAGTESSSTTRTATEVATSIASHPVEHKTSRTRLKTPDWPKFNAPITRLFNGKSTMHATSHNTKAGVALSRYLSRFIEGSADITLLI